MSQARREDGYSLVALVAGITIMLLLMGAAMPSWKYVVMSDREEELFFRGDSIATAIERFQKKNGNAYPTSLDQLVKGKFLRRAYTDPMTKSGKWRLLRPGDVSAPGFPGGGRRGRRGRGGEGGVDPSPAPSPSPSTIGGGPGTLGGEIGPIAGVASTRTDKSYKLMNGKDQYDQWLFVAGLPRGFGKLVLPSGPPGVPGVPPPPNIPVPPGTRRNDRTN